MPSTPANKLNDWIEYKRLVLAELERLNECIDKLQDGYVKLATQIHTCETDKKEILERLERLTKKIDDIHPLAVPEGRWKFYAAVATMIGSAIVSIISLLTALLSK